MMFFTDATMEKKNKEAEEGDSCGVTQSLNALVKL